MASKGMGNQSCLQGKVNQLHTFGLNRAGKLSLVMRINLDSISMLILNQQEV